MCLHYCLCTIVGYSPACFVSGRLFQGQDQETVWNLCTARRCHSSGARSLHEVYLAAGPGVTRCPPRGEGTVWHFRRLQKCCVAAYGQREWIHQLSGGCTWRITPPFVHVTINFPITLNFLTVATFDMSWHLHTGFHKFLARGDATGGMKETNHVVPSTEHATNASIQQWQVVGMCSIPDLYRTIQAQSVLWFWEHPQMWVRILSSCLSSRPICHTTPCAVYTGRSGGFFGRPTPQEKGKTIGSLTINSCNMTENLHCCVQ